MIPFPVLEMDGDPGGPLHFPFVIRDAEASFGIHCLSFRIRQYRIHEFPDAGTVSGIDDHQPFAEADLGGSQAAAIGRIHGFRHILQQAGQLFIETGNRDCLLPKDRGPDFHNVIDCHISSTPIAIFTLYYTIGHGKGGV